MWRSPYKRYSVRLSQYYVVDYLFPSLSSGQQEFYVSVNFTVTVDNTEVNVKIELQQLVSSDNKVQPEINSLLWHQVVCLLEKAPRVCVACKTSNNNKTTDTVLCRKWAFIKANKRLDYILF